MTSLKKSKKSAAGGTGGASITDQSRWGTNHGPITDPNRAPQALDLRGDPIDTHETVPGTNHGSVIGLQTPAGGQL